MCGDGFESGDYEPIVREACRWQRAKKDWSCCACRCSVPRGNLYHYSAVLQDGSWSSWKHCARCWAIVEHLWMTGAEGINLRLDCGEEYDAPDDDPGHALAFMTDAEAQAWALTQPKSEGFAGSWVDS